jgi:hypothetical protein
MADSVKGLRILIIVLIFPDFYNYSINQANLSSPLEFAFLIINNYII